MGLAGSFVLASAGYASRWLIPLTRADAAGQAWSFFRSQDSGLARAITEAFLDGVLPQDAALRQRSLDQAILSADRYFSAFSPAVQAEALEAFDLLDLWLVRRLIAGVSEPWERATGDEVNAFLESFRRSRLDTFRQIYRLLEGVATVGWYGQAASWPQLGYPGPANIERPVGEKPL